MTHRKMHRKINKVLIANRGEIAMRIIRTCRELDIQTVAIFSEADRTAPHVLAADEAYCVGPAPSAKSYLVVERVIEAAVASGAGAIHPGYGFLSENPRLAEGCREAGIVFIGPPSNAITTMGDKTAARSLMRRAGVPVVPGTADAVTDPSEVYDLAQEVGYPVLIKAAAGGGGKGMRVVEHEGELERALSAAQSEAASAFGDGRLFVEKYVAGPRHIEIQILADEHGNVVHLFERECSIQRRHQKVIEEAPSAIVDEGLRRTMGEAAVKAAVACGYVGAGTVEFLVDRDRNFYFMEMNTRLQVEHPVTELVTGIDLVAEQIRIAEGLPLSFGQDDLSINGHAVECRIYAEDPGNNFLPDTGRLLRYKTPGGHAVRVDDGVEEGSLIQVHYDPMIAKLVTWGRTRPEAIARMRRALGEYEIVGVATTIPFCQFVLRHPNFVDGNFDTHFVQDHFRPDVLRKDPESALPYAIAAAVHKMEDAAPSTFTNGRSNAAAALWMRRKEYR